MAAVVVPKLGHGWNGATMEGALCVGNVEEAPAVEARWERVQASGPNDHNEALLREGLSHTDSLAVESGYARGATWTGDEGAASDRIQRPCSWEA